MTAGAPGNGRARCAYEDAKGNVVRSTDDKPYHLDFLVPVAAATYDVRFAVVDASGAVGAVGQRVVVK